MKRLYSVVVWVNGEKVADLEHKTMEKALHQASYQLVKHGVDDKGYTINALELQFKKRNCPRVSFENSGRNFSLTLTKLHKTSK